MPKTIFFSSVKGIGRWQRLKCGLRTRRLFLVYFTQSLVGALVFVFNLSAVKVYLYLWLLAQLQKR